MKERADPSQAFSKLIWHCPVEIHNIWTLCSPPVSYTHLSFYNIPVDVREDDTIITLSTCSYEYDNFRLVVMGRKVREGEESTVHVSEITKNPNVLYPDVWYR